MKKAIFCILLCACMVFAGGCMGKNITYQASEIKVYNKKTDEFMHVLSEEETEYLLSVWNDSEWSKGLFKLSPSYVFKFNGKEIAYSPDPAAFLDYKNKRSLSLTIAQREYINTFILRLKEFYARNITEFNELQELNARTDKEALDEYLREGGAWDYGISSREHLEEFVELVETTPYVSWVDGEFSWIHYTDGTNSEGEVVKSLTISRKGANDEWTRTEYLVHYKTVEEGVKDQMSKYKAGKNHTFTEYQTPIQSADKLLTVYGQAHSPHPSGVGDEITYFADLGGKVTRIVYYTKQMASINAQEIISSLQVMPFKDYIADK